MPEFSFTTEKGVTLSVQCLAETGNEGMGQEEMATMSIAAAMTPSLNKYSYLCSPVVRAMKGGTLDDCRERLLAHGWRPVECSDRAYVIPTMGKNVREYLELETVPQEDLVLFCVTTYKVKPVASNRQTSVIAMCRTAELAAIIEQLATLDAIISDPPARSS